MTNRNKLDPATSFVRSLDGTYYMVREAAEILGVNHRTLRNFNEGDDPDLKPSFVGYLGKVKIYLYTDDDIFSIREHLEARKKIFPNDERSTRLSGRPARFSKEDRKERQKLYSKAHYYGKRAAEEEAKGNLRKASEYIAEQRRVRKKLKNWQIESSSESRTKRPSTVTEPGSSSNTEQTNTTENPPTTPQDAPTASFSSK